MKRRVSDRAVLRCLRRHGLDIEGVRTAIAEKPRTLAISVERYELDQEGLRHTLSEVRIITSAPIEGRK